MTKTRNLIPAASSLMSDPTKTLRSYR